MRTAKFLLALLFTASAAPAQTTNFTPPQILNLVSAQRPGTFLVDITYDLVDPDSTAVLVHVEASADGGATYGLPVSSLSGDYALVKPGTGKKIVWNAWNDWAGNYTTNARVRVIADDSASLTSPLPTNAPSADPNLVWILPGAFRMNHDIGRMVSITKPYLIGRYEVTQPEYLQVMSNNPSVNSDVSGGPVDSVTWTNAITYCQRLTTREQAAGRLPAGWAYRLPTEAEWEYACRAGTTNIYYFGNSQNQLTNYAWFSVNANSKSHSVGGKLPNRWGLYDMHGNVWEWCSDWYGDLPSANATDPQGPAFGSSRVTRGGSFWTSPASECTSSSRLGQTPSGEYHVLGFRVVLAPVQ